MHYEAPQEVTGDSIFTKYITELETPEKEAEAILNIQKAIDEGYTEFRLAKYTGDVSDDEAKVAAQINLQEGREIELTTWQSFAGTDHNSEWTTLIAAKPKQEKSADDFQI